MIQAALAAALLAQAAPSLPTVPTDGGKAEARALIDTLLLESQVRVFPGISQGTRTVLVETEPRGSTQPGVCERDVLTADVLSAAPAPARPFDPRAAVRSLEAHREFALIAVRADDQRWSGEHEARCSELPRKMLNWMSAESPWEPWLAGQLIAQLDRERRGGLARWRCKEAARCPGKSATDNMLRPEALVTVQARAEPCPQDTICLRVSLSSWRHNEPPEATIQWQLVAQAPAPEGQSRQLHFTDVQIAPIDLWVD